MAVPSAPTGLTVQPVPHRGRATFSWTYVGTGAQTGYGFRWRPVGDVTWRGEALTLTGSSPSALFPPNQAVNGGVESGTTSWESNPSLGSFLVAGFAATTVKAYEGTSSLRATWPSARRSSWVNQLVSHHVAGAKYVAEAQVQGEPDAGRLGIEAIFKSQGTLRLATPRLDKWTWISRTYTATSAGTHVGVRAVEIRRPGAQAWVDAFKVYEFLTPGSWEVQVRTSNADGFGAWSATATVEALDVEAYRKVGGVAVPHMRFVRSSSGWSGAVMTRKVA